MLTQQDIIDFCNKYDYDIRKSGNGRWIDQKCAADVVTVIADCIYNYESENPESTSLHLIYGIMITLLKMSKLYLKSQESKVQQLKMNMINSFNNQWKC